MNMSRMFHIQLPLAQGDKQGSWCKVLVLVLAHTALSVRLEEHACKPLCTQLPSTFIPGKDVVMYCISKVMGTVPCFHKRMHIDWKKFVEDIRKETPSIKSFYFKSFG